MKILVVGGGAAGFFYAANASLFCPEAEITILESSRKVLAKVRVSGGGRCNVTHACFEAEELVKNYPRGEKELRGPFTRFGPSDTVEWFESRGVKIKAEADGRMFPVSDSSESIIKVLKESCEAQGVTLRTHAKAVSIETIENGQNGFEITLESGERIFADKLFIASGSNNQTWTLLGKMGIELIDPVPSLFTFKIEDAGLNALAGISVDKVSISIPSIKGTASGPLLITHRGLSGPGVLKLSAQFARKLHDLDYSFGIDVDFVPGLAEEEIRQWRQSVPKKQIGNHQLVSIPRRLFAMLLNSAGLKNELKYADISRKQEDALIRCLKRSRFEVLGKDRFKEEFVTAGGVDLKEIQFSDFSSKKYPNMSFGGEVLNIDAVTGGFNFQAAWTGAFLAAKALSTKDE